ncbi:ATP-dependent RNA helicase DBP7 [Kluyveromyces marxianus]
MSLEDDDGMLLNFTTDVSSEDRVGSKSNSKVTGGKWKDRRRAKLLLEGRKPRGRARGQEFPGAEVSGEGSEDLGEGELEVKRSRYEQVKAREEAAAKPAAPREVQLNAQIVSSLFTSSRTIDTVTNNNAHDDSAEVNPSNAPLVGDTFEDFGITETMVKHLNEKMKISKPTKIQKLVIPPFMQAKNDLFIHAQTGSGKTLAFLLPIFQKILSLGQNVNRQSGCFALIVTPTRELANQIYQVTTELAQCCHFLVPCLLIGGERKKSEKARLRKGANFIIGTPGRVLDHLQNTKVITEQLAPSLRYVILDEGDKLMELGFEETLKEILNIIHGIDIDIHRFPKLPKRILHVLCSATVKGNVSKLGNVTLQDYKLISSGQKQTETTTVPDQLIQKIAIVPPKLRLVTLAGVLTTLTQKHYKLAKTECTRTIVFLSCSDSVDFHYETFSSNDGNYRGLVGDTARLLTKGSTVLPCFSDQEDPNVICYKLHGSLSQQTRTATLKHFATNNDATKGRHLILFCTDVASRGLDLPHVSTVIEMDPPFAVEDHLHRIGRTARAGCEGESLLFLLPGEEEGYMDYIKPYHPKGWKLLTYDEQILRPAFEGLIVRRTDKKKADWDKHEAQAWDNNATTWHLNVERRVLEDSHFKELAVKGYMSHIRAYATHLSQEKQFFNLKCVHLGHLAKSFALRERPKSMGLQQGKAGSAAAASQKKPKEDAKSKMLRMARMAMKQSNDEFNFA